MPHTRCDLCGCSCFTDCYRTVRNRMGALSLSAFSARHAADLRECCEHSCLDTVGGPCPPCPPLAPVLFRVPALFGVFRRVERRSLSCSSPLHLLCCLRAAHALAAARPAPAALGPSPPRRAPRAAPPAAPPAAPRTGPVRTTATASGVPLLSTMSSAGSEYNVTHPPLKLASSRPRRPAVDS